MLPFLVQDWDSESRNYQSWSWAIQSSWWEAEDSWCYIGYDSILWQPGQWSGAAMQISSRVIAISSSFFDLWCCEHNFWQCCKISYWILQRIPRWSIHQDIQLTSTRAERPCTRHFLCQNMQNVRQRLNLQEPTTWTSQVTNRESDQVQDRCSELSSLWGDSRPLLPKCKVNFRWWYARLQVRISSV